MLSVGKPSWKPENWKLNDVVHEGHFPGHKASWVENGSGRTNEKYLAIGPWDNSISCLSRGISKTALKGSLKSLI